MIAESEQENMQFDLLQDFQQLKVQPIEFLPYQK